MEGFAPILIVFFIFIFNSLLLKKGKDQGQRSVKKAVTVNPIPVRMDEEDKGGIEIPSFMTAQKPTLEKTHSHKGEVSQAVLLEDRQHDWLAEQIREEARLARKRMQ